MENMDIVKEKAHSYEKMRGKDIISLIYPKHENIIEKVHTDSVNKTSYEFISIEVVDNITIGYLFLNKYISIQKTLYHFVKNLTEKLHNLYIFTPRIYKNGNEVNRVKSINDIIKKYSELKPIENINTEIHTIDDFVWKKCLSSKIKESNLNIEKDKYFVDQELFVRNKLNKYENLGFSINYINELINSTETKKPIHIISGSGGVGKTSFCESLVSKVNSSENKFSILISSTDLKSINIDFDINTISDLYNLNVKATNVEQNKTLESTNLEINISCGNIILIIDGLDEIESSLKEKFNLKNFINSAIQLNELYNNCRIIITTRDYNIDRFNEFKNLSIYLLQGFSNEIAYKYFKKRFSSEKDVKEAKKYLIKHDIGKFSHYIPLYISLICDSIEREKYSFDDLKKSIQGSLYYSGSFLIDNLIYDVLQREILKQSLNITCDEYFDILSEIVINNKGRISIDLLNEYISILFPKISPTSSSKNKKYAQFYVCPLILENSDNSFSVAYDFLEVWIKSRYLFNALRSNIYNDHVRNLLAEMYTGKSYILTELLDLQKEHSINLEEVGRKIINNSNKELNTGNLNRKATIQYRHAISGFLYFSVLSKNNPSREIVTSIIKSLYDNKNIYGMYVYGDFFPIDFTDLIIRDSVFDGYKNMHKCSFPDDKTVFFYSKLTNIVTVLKQTFNKKLFDSTCTLDDDFAIQFENNIKSSNHLQELCINDLNKILKVGFSNGAFYWKSELIYRKVSFSSNLSLSQYLNFLCEHGVLNKEKAKVGRGIGYIVSKEFRNSAKYLISNTKLKPDLELVIVSMLNQFYGLTKSLV